MAEPIVSSFALEPAMWRHTWSEGKFVRQPETHFLDFVIDGHSIRDSVDDDLGLVTPLCRTWLEAVPDEVERLLGHRPTEGLSSGRVAVLVCGMDGDRGCGAVTAQVGVSAGQVGWTDWLWESFNEPLPVEQLTSTLVFDREQYEQALAMAFERVAAMPYDALAHRGKGFLWPLAVGLADARPRLNGAGHVPHYRAG